MRVLPLPTAQRSIRAVAFQAGLKESRDLVIFQETLTRPKVDNDLQTAGCLTFESLVPRSRLYSVIGTYIPRAGFLEQFILVLARLKHTGGVDRWLGHSSRAVLKDKSAALGVNSRRLARPSQFRNLICIILVPQGGPNTGTRSVLLLQPLLSPGDRLCKQLCLAFASDQSTCTEFISASTGHRKFNQNNK